MIDQIMKSAKADSIPEGLSSSWLIEKQYLQERCLLKRRDDFVFYPPGSYTTLFCCTNECNFDFDVVVEDSVFELKTHLNFMLRAHGRVLINGLGLGCVVRGCLVNPNVDEVVCIEKSEDVLSLVEPHMPKESLTIINADALDWCKSNTDYFDCAWHDLWSDTENGEPSLNCLHMELIKSCRRFTKFQGAWGLDRTIKKAVKRYLKKVA